MTSVCSLQLGTEIRTLVAPYRLTLTPPLENRPIVPVKLSPSDLGGALADVDPDLHAFTIVVDGSDPDFVDDVETGAERRVLGVDAGALVGDQVEPLARPAVDLVAEEEPGEVEGPKLPLIDLDGHGEERVAYDGVVDELLVA